MAIAVRIRDLEVSYRGHVVLSIPNATLESGIWALVGPNGAGKTTFIEQIIDAAIDAIPHIEFCDQQQAVEIKYSRQVGYLPQDFGYYRHFTVREFVQYFALLRGIHKHDAQQMADDALSRVNLLDRADTRMHTLSGGMVQRAGIAQALVHRPSLLLLDEPTAGLDLIQAQQIMDIVESLQDQTVIFSTHSTEDIAALDCNILVLNQGQIAFMGGQSELRAATPHGDLRSSLVHLFQS